MAATATASEEQVPKVPLRLLVDKEKNRVVFAEAGKDFLDVLLSFLTLPLGTIARLVGRESNMQPVRVGCLSSLYQSVANFDQECLWTEACKEMLLKPRNSMETYCRKLKLNIDNTDPIKFFISEDWNCIRNESDCRLLSIFRNLRCRCGKLMDKEISPDPISHYPNLLHNGIVHETATFIICDDLSVMPNDIETSVALLQKQGIIDMDAIEEQTVNISKNEVVDLLKCSLLSETPLTDCFLKKKQFLDNFDARVQSQFEIGELTTDEDRKMSAKIVLNKHNSKILFAQGGEDFVDFLFSFLTLPLGGVLAMHKGCSSLSCVGKLYNSIAELSSDRHLISEEVKDNLSNPQCAPQFKLSNQILPIGAACFPQYYCVSYENRSRAINGFVTTSPDSYRHASSLPDYWDHGEIEHLNFVDPKSCTGETSSLRGFAKGPSMFMVTDDLVVTPVSSISFVSFLNRSKVPICDLEERVISIGLKEGLSILRASLISTSALTSGLSQIIETIKEEN